MVGEKQGRLMVLSIDESPIGRHRYCVCKCDCGKSKRVRVDHLKSGRIRSCGCLVTEVTTARNLASRRHGHAASHVRTPTYRSWIAMHTRCGNPNHDGYSEYGGRGISVCEEWKSFERFLSDMGERPSGTTIDRIDNSRGYEPGNCQWASHSEQENNKRATVKITFKGRSHSIAEWARITGIGYQTLRKRLEYGWPPERILTQKIGATP